MLNRTTNNNYRTTLTATKQSITTVTGPLVSLYAINPNSVPVYIKAYEGPAAAVTVGTTTPRTVLMVPAESFLSAELNLNFRSGIVMAATTELTDSGTTAPATALSLEVGY